MLAPNLDEVLRDLGAILLQRLVESLDRVTTLSDVDESRSIRDLGAILLQRLPCKNANFFLFFLSFNRFSNSFIVATSSHKQKKHVCMHACMHVGILRRLVITAVIYFLERGNSRRMRERTPAIEKVTKNQE